MEGLIGAVEGVQRRQRRIILTIIALVLLVGVIIGYILLSREEQPASLSPEILSLKQESSDTSAKNQTKLAEQYGDQYDAAYAEVTAADATSWNKEMLDKAYTALLYADKIGAYSQAIDVLSSMRAAEAEGLNLDDNSWGMRQADRDAIEARANAAQDVQVTGADDE